MAGVSNQFGEGGRRSYASAGHVTGVGASKLVALGHETGAGHVTRIGASKLVALGHETGAGHVARIGASEFVAGDNGISPSHQL